MYAICVDEPPFLLVTEFLENGDLKNYLKKEEAKIKLTFDKLIRISENVSGRNVKSDTLANLNIPSTVYIFTCERMHILIKGCIRNG